MKRLGGFLLLLVLLIPAATAATITISPDAIESGDTVTVTVNDLPDNATFSLGIRGEFAATPGETFAFSARDLTLPFALNNGEVNAYTRGTNLTELAAELPDGGSVIMRKYADANNEVRIAQSQNIGSGTISLVTLSGTAAAERIIADMTVMGTKQGPEDGTISFAIEGVAQGTATVTVYVDGAEALSRQITIGGGIPTPTPTVTATQGSSGGNGGNGGSSGGSTTPTPTAGPATVTSADGKASLTGADIAGAGLQALLPQGNASAGWSLSGNAYAVTPANRAFNPAATLALRLPSAETTATIARYENGAWTPVPSKVEGDRISTPVSRVGTYALLVPAEAPTLAATVTTTTVATTATTPAATTPTAAPMAPLLTIAALAILMLGWRGRV
ncbi:hypothetical protein [Methanoculleus sp.]|uniref:hypothetical protein n=1 Tax=Methanoculleus sp. TaxID=90427 RepID=UPI002FCB1E9F